MPLTQVSYVRFLTLWKPLLVCHEMLRLLSRRLSSYYTVSHLYNWNSIFGNRIIIDCSRNLPYYTDWQ